MKVCIGLSSLLGCLNPVSTPNIREEILAYLEGRSIDESRQVLLVFATLFDIYKSYQNSIVVEISAILAGGILRCISLGQTEGFNSYNTVGFINYQSIVYLIGRNVLGRLFNVTGSCIDLYNEVTTICLLLGLYPPKKPHHTETHTYQNQS